MKDWGDYAQTIKDSSSETGGSPSIWGYIGVKFIDNLLPFSVFVLTIIFSVIALFILNSEAEQQKLNWALHAAELCLGVFLGLLKGSKSA